MATPNTGATPASSGGVAAFLKNNLREYGLLIALVIILVWLPAQAEAVA